MNDFGGKQFDWRLVKKILACKELFKDNYTKEEKLL